MTDEELSIAAYCYSIYPYGRNMDYSPITIKDFGRESISIDEHYITKINNIRIFSAPGLRPQIFCKVNYDTNRSGICVFYKESMRLFMVKFGTDTLSKYLYKGPCEVLDIKFSNEKKMVKKLIKLLEKEQK